MEDIVLEARFVANKIKEVISYGNYEVYDKKQGYRKLQYRDIVILLRATSNLASIYEKELNEYDVLCAEFLKAVLRRQKINNNKFEILKNKILEMYNGNLKNLIGIRLEAVKLYYNGNIVLLCFLHLILPISFPLTLL